jgi:hypothetical protein
MDAIKEAGYSGIIFDVENVDGTFDSINPLFDQAFRAAKRADLTVIVTVSHSAPYKTKSLLDGKKFVKSFAKSSNIDALSPQLYSTGTENQPDFDETFNCKDKGCTWDLYKTSKPRFIPSIVDSSHYDKVKEFFSNKGIKCSGFLQWK